MPQGVNNGRIKWKRRHIFCKSLYHQLAEISLSLTLT